MSLKDIIDKIRQGDFFEQKIDLYAQEVTDTDISLLANTLKKYNIQITELLLGANKISDIGVAYLIHIDSLRTLDISENIVGPKGAQMLAKKDILIKLNVSANPMGDAIAVFENASNLAELNASQCKITDMGAQSLFLSHSIKKLDLSSNKISGTSLKNIESNQSLNYLDLHQNRLAGEQLCHIVNNSSLKHLDLTSTFVRDEGAKWIAQNTSLETVLLMQDLIGDEGAFALSRNTTLKKLILYSNHITDVGAREFLNPESTLLHLDLCSNKLTDKGKEIIRIQYPSTRNNVFIRTPEELALLKKSHERIEPILHAFPMTVTSSGSSSESDSDLSAAGSDPEEIAPSLQKKYKFSTGLAGKFPDDIGASV